MMDDDALKVTVESLRNIFAIVLALSLGEAFKQVVADRADDPTKKSMRFDSLFAIASFLLLLIPFYQRLVERLSFRWMRRRSHKGKTHSSSDGGA